jgi:putative transposase
MKRTAYGDEQIAYALRQAEARTAMAAVWRQLGTSEAAFYVWRRRFGHIAVAEVRALGQLLEENPKLKRLVADRSLDKSILSEIVKILFEAGTKHLPCRSVAYVPAGTGARHRQYSEGGPHWSLARVTPLQFKEKVLQRNLGNSVRRHD